MTNLKTTFLSFELNEKSPVYGGKNDKLKIKKTKYIYKYSQAASKKQSISPIFHMRSGDSPLPLIEIQQRGANYKARQSEEI